MNASRCVHPASVDRHNVPTSWHHPYRPTHKQTCASENMLRDCSRVIDSDRDEARFYGLKACMPIVKPRG